MEIWVEVLDIIGLNRKRTYFKEIENGLPWKLLSFQLFGDENELMQSPAVA